MFRSIGPSDLCHETPRRICVIKPSALGDVVLALPLLPVLKARFPQASISWVINRELKDLIEGHPHVEEVLLFDRKAPWREQFRLASDLRSRRFDLVFDLQGLLRSAVMTLATRAPIRVGLQTAREGAHLAVNCVLPDTGWNVPAHARLWRVAEILGFADAPRETIVTTSDADRTWADGMLASLPRPVIAVHPGAGWETKRWPVEKFAALITRFSQAWGGSTIIVGGPNERVEAERLTELLAPTVSNKSSLDAGGTTFHGLENRATVAVSNKSSLDGGVINLAGRTTLKQLARIMASIDVMVSNDSGPMHLATGLRIPTLGLFTCTSAAISGPSGTRHELVSTTVPCAASYCKRCPNAGQMRLACLRELDVERAWSALQRLVARNNIPTSTRRAA